MSCWKNLRVRGALEIWGWLDKVSGYLQDDAIDRSMYYYSLLPRFNEAFLITLFQRIFRHNDDVYHDYTKSAKKKNTVRVEEWLSLNQNSPQKKFQKKWDILHGNVVCYCDFYFFFLYHCDQTR